MDYKPAQIIHAIRLGLDDLVFNSKTMWLCASCETCTTRCPQEVDVAKVMDAVKIIAARRGIKPAKKLTQTSLNVFSSGPDARMKGTRLTHARNPISKGLCIRLSITAVNAKRVNALRETFANSFA